MEHVDELIAGHALHGLSPADEERVALHVADCARCRRQLREMEAVAASLAYAVPAAAPPAGLRASLLAAVEPVVRAPEAAERPRRAWWPRVSAVLAPALAAAVVGLGAWTASLHGQLSDLRSGLESGTAATLPGVGTAVMAPDGRVTLYAHLGPAPAGRTYEAWVIRGNRPLPAGTFAGAGETTLTMTARRGDTVAVTVERAGGSSRPTTAPLATARLA